MHRAARVVRRRSCPARSRRPTVPVERHAGCAGRHVHGVLNGVNIFPKTALFDTATLAGELTWMQWSKVTQNEAVFKGRSSYTAIDKVIEELLRARVQLHADLVPGLARASTCSRRSRGARASPATRRSLFGGSENGGNWSAGVAADIYQKYRIDLKYSGYYGDYSTNPTTGHARRRRHGRAQRRELVAVRPRLGVAHVQDHILTRSHDHVSQITDGARHRFAALPAQRAGGGVGRRGQAARHDADARSAPRRPATRTARFPSTPGGIKPPAGLQGRQRRPARPVREREAAPVDHRQGRGRARRQADRRHEGAAEALSDDARRRLSDASHGRVAAAGPRQHAQERDRREDHRRRRRARERAAGLPVPDSRRPAPKRSGTTCCATTASATTIRRYENWNVDAAGVPTLAVDGRRELGVADLRPEEVGTDQRQRSLLARQARTTSDRRAATARRCCGSTPSIR